MDNNTKTISDSIKEIEESIERLKKAQELEMFYQVIPNLDEERI